MSVLHLPYLIDAYEVISWNLNESNRPDLITMLNVLIILPFCLHHRVHAGPHRTLAPNMVKTDVGKHFRGDFLIEESLLRHKLHYRSHAIARAAFGDCSGCTIELKCKRMSWF